MNDLRRELCRVCTLLYDRGYVVGHDGNVSLRADGDQILITPSGVSKGRMTPDMLVLCDLEGRVLAGDRYPSSEMAMHLLVYREQPTVNAVVHAHPPPPPPLPSARNPWRRPTSPRPSAAWERYRWPPLPSPPPRRCPTASGPL